MTDSNYWDRLGMRAVSRREVLRSSIFAGAGLGAAALVGCSSASKPATTQPGASAGSAASGAPAANVRTGGRLTEVGAYPPSLDFTREVTAGVPTITMPVYNSLLKFDTTVELQEFKTVQPDLAEKWEIAGDGQSYTFKLVKNAKFHDGTPFTSADVKASFLRQQNPPAGVVMPRGSQIQAVKSFETPDDYTIVMKLSRPSSPSSFLQVLAQHWMGIYSRKDIEGKFDFVTKMNGTGPFRLKSADQTTKISYDKNKDYFVKDRPYLDGIDIYNIPDASTKLAQIQAGAINISAASTEEFKTLKQALGSKAQFQSVLLQTVSALVMNSNRAPFNDDRVRRAMALAYNKEDGNKLLTDNEGVTGGYMFPNGGWALPKEELEKIPGYGPYSEASLAEAKKLMAAAGVKAGTNVSILTRQGSGAGGGSGESHSLFLADQMKKIDLVGKLDIQTTAKEYDAANAGNFDTYIIALAFFVDDPDSVYPDHFLTNSPLNYNKLGSKAVDDLFLKQSVELDTKKRVELVRDMERQAVPQLSKFVFRYYRNRIVTQKVKDFIWPNHQSSNHQMQNVWLEA